VGPLIKRLFPARRRVHRATPTDLLAWGAALHLIVDWLTQNEWVAEHKHRVVHPAGYVHAGSHAAAQAVVFPVPIAAALGLTHLIVDTRQPLRLWKKVVSQPDRGPAAVPVGIWRDQTAHLAFITLAAVVADPRKRRSIMNR
jgi:hypothetical protein